jgi:hypothetical protein
MVRSLLAQNGEGRVKPYDRLTIVRNRHRARELRVFRRLVYEYFVQSEYDVEDLPIDWAGAGATRAEINRMLPRMLQIVQAAELGRSSSGSPRHVGARAVEILERIFDERPSGGAFQEILDVIDMATGVYDANQFAALMRTLNPFYYVTTALGYLAGLPRSALVAIGVWRPRPVRRKDDVIRFEAALERIAGSEALLETQFAEMRHWQARQFAEHADRLSDVADRMEFLERVLAQRPPVPQLDPGENRATTPV